VFDEVIGSIEIDVEELIENAKKKKNSVYCWKNVYGSPMGYEDSEPKKQMNLFPESASNWKGRVLMQIECVETEKPAAKVLPIED
jgi:hypothetical protein